MCRARYVALKLSLSTCTQLATANELAWICATLRHSEICVGNSLDKRSLEALEALEACSRLETVVEVN